MDSFKNWFEIQICNACYNFSSLGKGLTFSVDDFSYQSDPSCYATIEDPTESLWSRPKLDRVPAE